MGLQVGGGSPSGAGGGSYTYTYTDANGQTHTATNTSGTLPTNLPPGSTIDPTKTSTTQVGPTPGTVTLDGGAPQAGTLGGEYSKDHPSAPPAAPAPPPAAAPAPPANPFGGELLKPTDSENFFKDTADLYKKPSAAENVNDQYGGGLFKDLSYTEQLYNQGIGQLNPYYDYAQQRAIEQARNASSARGGFNSSYAMRQEGDISANLRGQQARDMAALAQASDSAKMGRYGLGETFARGADSDMISRLTAGQSAAGNSSAAKLSRLGSYFSNALGLGQAEGSATNPFASDNSALQLQIESINSALQKGQIDAKTAQGYLDTLGALGKLGVAAAGAGGGGNPFDTGTMPPSGG